MRCSRASSGITSFAWTAGRPGGAKWMLCYPHGCMAGVVLDGRRINQEIRQELKPRIDALRDRTRAPGLAVILAGDDPASHIYVRDKIKTCHELGITSLDVTPPANISQHELLELIQEFNADPNVDGIL